MLCKAGFVHRDVSAGNSLFYRDNEKDDKEGRGILSDFEYAKEYGKISASDPKTVSTSGMSSGVRSSHHE